MLMKFLYVVVVDQPLSFFGSTVQHFNISSDFLRRGDWIIMSWVKNPGMEPVGMIPLHVNNACYYGICEAKISVT